MQAFRISIKLCFILFCFLFVLALVAQPLSWANYHPPTEQTPLAISSEKKVQNIIFLIGDGMSSATVSMARYRAVGKNGKLHMDRMPITGYIRVCPADQLITDSAASATAMACGIKTANGTIGMDIQEHSYQSIMEICKQLGKSCGLVATSSITHATPAAFYAHAPKRSQQAFIAEQLIQSGFDVFLGGGRGFFLPQSAVESKRKDDRDLIAEAITAGYFHLSTRDELLQTRHSRILGLFAIDGMTTQPPEPTLAEMTSKAIQILSQNKKGFMLMVEGSQIDWANHDNNADNSVQQTLDFDMAIATALDFAQKNRKTLVVVTADHETGGLVITGGSADGYELQVSWSGKNHTGGDVPLYAYGPGAIKFAGFRENSEIPRIFAELLKIKNFPIQKAVRSVHEN